MAYTTSSSNNSHCDSPVKTHCDQLQGVFPPEPAKIQDHDELLNSPCSSSLSPEMSKNKSVDTLLRPTKTRPALPAPAESVGTPLSEVSGRDKLKRHRTEVAGHVWIPDIWGQEELLKDWADCSVFDSSLVPKGIMSARASLIQEGARTSSRGCVKS